MFRYQGKILNKVLWMNLDTNLRNIKRRKVPFWMCPWRWARDVRADPMDGLIHSWIRIWADYEEGAERGSLTLETYFWGRCLALFPSLWLTALFCFPPALMWAAIPHRTRHRGQRHLGTTEGSESFCKLLARALRRWRRADSTSAFWSHWQSENHCPFLLQEQSSVSSASLAGLPLIWVPSKKKSQINNDWKLKICSWPLNTSKTLQLSPGLLVCNSYVPWILQRFNLLPRKQKSPFNVWVLHGHNLIQLGKETEHRLYGEV